MVLHKDKLCSRKPDFRDKLGLQIEMEVSLRYRVNLNLKKQPRNNQKNRLCEIRTIVILISNSVKKKKGLDIL